MLFNLNINITCHVTKNNFFEIKWFNCFSGVLIFALNFLYHHLIRNVWCILYQLQRVRLGGNMGEGTERNILSNLFNVIRL